MFFRTDDDARLGIFKELRSRGLMFSSVQVVADPNMTMCINLITYELIIGRRFLYNVIRNYDDIGFSTKHEVGHRYIATQWNKMRWIGAIVRKRPTANSSLKDINWLAVNIAEDAFINAYFRNTGEVVSDFPEYYYCNNGKLKHAEGINKWLCNLGKFPKTEIAKNKLLKIIRNNDNFFIDLNKMAEVYWYIVDDMKKDEQNSNNEDGTKKKKPKLFILTTDDPTGTGEEICYGTESEEKIVIIQAEQMKSTQFPSLAGHSIAVETIFVPDTECDKSLSEIFNVRTKDMVSLNEKGSSTVLVDYIDSIVEQSRNMGEDLYKSIDVPSTLSRHDRIMSVGFDTDPFYWDHNSPQNLGEDEKEIKWDIYIDASGSMSNEIPLARWIAKRLEHLCRKLYVFSDGVWEYDGGNWINTTGGTNMNVAMKYAFTTECKHIMFIGDGQCGYGPDHWNDAEMIAWWKNSVESLMILMEPIRYHNRYLDLACSVFNHVVDFYANKTYSHYEKA